MEPNSDPAESFDSGLLAVIIEIDVSVMLGNTLLNCHLLGVAKNIVHLGTLYTKAAPIVIAGCSVSPSLLQTHTTSQFVINGF